MLISKEIIEFFANEDNHNWNDVDKIATRKFGKEPDNMIFVGIDGNKLIYKASFYEKSGIIKQFLKIEYDMYDTEKYHLCSVYLYDF